MTVIELTDATFAEVVGGSDAPVLVEFGATWCGPCRQLAPILDQLATEQSGRLVVGTVDIDDNLDTARRHEIMSAPTLLLFVDGELVWRKVGARGKGQLVQELAAWLEPVGAPGGTGAAQ